MLKITNFRYHGNRGRSEQSLTNTLKLAIPENPLLGASITVISHMHMANFVLKIANFRYHGNRGRSEQSLSDTLKSAVP